MKLIYSPEFEQPIPRKSGRSFVFPEGRVELVKGENDIDDKLAEKLFEDSEVKLMLDWGALKKVEKEKKSSKELPKELPKEPT